jgi:protein-disulfide isomerase
MFRKLSLVVAMFLYNTAAVAGGLGEMTASEKAAFQAEVRAYLIENPEVLVEAMEVLRARDDANAVQKDAQMLSQNKQALFADPASYVGGNLNGDITVIEFLDYRCGYCRKAHDEVAELIKSDGNIRFIVKEYPILGEDSLVSAKFAIAILQIYGAEPYFKAHEILIALRGTPDPENLAQLATDLNLDPKAIFERMSTPEVENVVANNQALGVKMDITGTPTFVIGDTILRGYLPLDQMRAIVAQERNG